ncbi:MAG TPA: hypothetical protein VGS07_02305 [Thermoanaerobaculia bacterium]|jgi:hypothetical protein|nr:hypothetical protein [Thermoanaerobaculia bacterium]
MAKIEQVRKALDLFSGELSRLKNVVGLGRVPSKTKSGDWDLAVYVARKVPPDELAAAELVPKTLDIPGRGKSHPVTTQVIEQGTVSLETPGIEKL